MQDEHLKSVFLDAAFIFQSFLFFSVVFWAFGAWHGIFSGDPDILIYFKRFKISPGTFKCCVM